MSEEIAVALVGYGFVGKTVHAPLIAATPGLALHTVVSSDAAKVHADHPKVAVVPELSEALADPAIDLVVIATPNALHAPQAHAALDAGKAVVVDKPFTVTVEEAREVVEHAKAAGRLLSVFQNRRWDSDFLTVKKLIENGTFGTLSEFHSHYDRFRPKVQDRWRERAGPGAGIWFDLGPHLLDQVLQLFGAPQAIYADFAEQRPGGQATDYFNVLLRYPGHRVTLHGGAIVPDSGLRFAIHGTGGSFFKHGLDTQEDALKAGRKPGSTGPGGEGWGHDPRAGRLIRVVDGAVAPAEEILAEPGNYRAYYVAIRDALTGLGPNPVTPEQALQLMTLLGVAARSAAERREITI